MHRPSQCPHSAERPQERSPRVSVQSLHIQITAASARVCPAAARRLARYQQKYVWLPLSFARFKAYTLFAQSIVIFQCGRRVGQYLLGEFWWRNQAAVFAQPQGQPAYPPGVRRP